MRASLGHSATVVVFVLLTTTAAVAAERMKNKCHSHDKAALLAIKAGFNNASYFESWTPNNPCCEWYGVFCNGSASPYNTRRVLTVSFIGDNSLAGPLPGAAIARLTALQQLVLVHVPGVNGTIPADLIRLSPTLNYLQISHTGVSGPVPSFLSELTALDYLDLSFNHLMGPIPPLLLSKTKDTTSYLCLSHNKLTGGIPAEFAAVQFWGLDLSHNAFAGDASVLFGLNKSLQTLDLSHNTFSFNLSVVTLPEQLVMLDLSHNDIYGELLPQVANLEHLNVSYNHLSGTVPTGGNMDRFDQYCFQNNEGLCGTPLPLCK